MGFCFLDLLKLRKVDVIIHQVNCLCVKPHGLSRKITGKYPWGDIDSTRRAEGKTNLAVVEDRGIPGTIEIFKSLDPLRPNIVCFFKSVGLWYS